jgi:hypothetical protein
MKYSQKKFPLGSYERIIYQLEKTDLIKALKTCRTGNIALNVISNELNDCLKKLYIAGSFGTILSGYYISGIFGEYTAEELLFLMSKKDIPGFLKQIYRLGIYQGFEEEINYAIQWHESRNLNDAFAWRLKFQKVVEQLELSNSQIDESVTILEEDQSINSLEKIYHELKPININISHQQKVALVEAENEDPYIISRTARSKMERANYQHARTLEILSQTLSHIGCEVGQTRLIDAFSVVKNRPVIFEVKSITETNERAQVRHAISQLYEYRFLYSMKDALLCLVFSQRPFSKWLIDYLVHDRNIHILWVENERIEGTSRQELIDLI